MKSWGRATAPWYRFWDAMYAIATRVRALARNVRSGLTDSEIEEFAAQVDDEIDSALENAFRWPKNSSGVVLNSPPPRLIRTIASYMTAGLIEMTKYAHNEAGQATPNPYGRTLESKGRSLLSDVVLGKRNVPELESHMPGRVSTPSAPIRRSQGVRGWR